ncbi:MAG: response regulator [Verrucomicrobia bacterium]|nr:response regulator [Verrucomicrobiota bacterium]
MIRMMWRQPAFLRTIKAFALLGFLFSGGLHLATAQEFGHPLFHSFGLGNYGPIGQLFAVTEDARGRMLFGCRNAILTFDNYRWETIATPETGSISGLAIDDAGTVWFSTSTQIGYLSWVGNQRRTVKVYSGALGANSKVICFDHKIYFATENGLLIWHSGNLSVRPWTIDSINPSSLTVFHGKIAVGSRNGSIYELAGDRFNEIAETPEKDPGAVRAIVDCPIGDGLVIKQTGIFQKIGFNLVPWRTNIDSSLEGSSIFSARWILGKYLAILVQSRGIFLVDGEGHLVESFTINNGLTDAGFQALGEDRDEGLWTCSNTKIFRIQFGSGCTVFDHESGLPGGSIGEVVRFQGKVYSGAQRGVYVLRTDASTAEASRFVPFSDRDVAVNGITINGGAAFVYSNSGTYLLDPASSRLNQIGPGALYITPSKLDSTRIFLGTATGVQSIRKSNDQWRFEGSLPSFPYAVEGIESDADGNLLVCTDNNGFYRVRLAKNASTAFQSAVVEPLLDREDTQVPSGNGSICFWRGKTLLVGADRVWQLSNDSNRLEPFELTVKSLPSRKISSINVSRLTDDYVWVVSRPPGAGPRIGFEVGKLYQSGKYEPLSHRVTYPAGVIYSIWDENIDGEPVVWIAGDYGLRRINLDRPAFNTRTFDVYCNELIPADTPPTTVQNGQNLALKYDDRDFQISFGTDHFSVGNELSYWVQLEGQVKRAFAPTTSPIWRSGALNEGRYLVHVKARDSNGVESKEFTFGFTIAPPWYRTVWMKIGWGALTILAFYCFNRWRTWRLRLRQRELEQTVELRTRELRDNEIQLRSAKEAAESARQNADSANRAKTVFLANMSHELRTPINGILGYGQLLLRRLDINADVKAKIKRIITSGEHLLGVINEVLDLSKVEAGKLAVNFRSVDLRKFLAGIVDEFEVRASGANVRFVHQIQGNWPPSIETDPLRLRQVLYNLLANAFKFTNQGEVALRITIEQTRLIFQVKDTGKGISQSDLPLIFEPFYQATSNDPKNQGAGLGLHITKQVVELLGGKISVASELGHGCSFTVDIPRRDASPVFPKLESRQIIGYQGPRRKILIVDDELLNRLMLRELLSLVGFDTADASTPREAFSLLRDHVDAVISDIRMPGYDGHTWCRELRSAPETKHLIIIASSGSVFADDQRLALDSGFTDFLPKPVMEEELFETLGHHLKLNWIYASPTRVLE